MLLTRIKALHLGMYLTLIRSVHTVSLTPIKSLHLGMYLLHQSDHSIEVSLNLSGQQRVVPHANHEIKVARYVVMESLNIDIHQ